MTRLVRPFIAGLLVVLPVVLTLTLLAWVVNLIYSFVGPGSLFFFEPRTYVNATSP